MSVALFSGLTAVASAPSASAANARLSIAAPTQARVGEAIPITLTLEGASRVAGYEAFASFDRSVAEFGGLFAGGEDAPQVDVQTTVTDESSGGAPFAVYTCEAADCPGDQNNKHEGRRQLENLKLRVVPLTPGALDIRFDDLRFVDKKGRRLDVDVQGAEVSVGVDGATEELAPPPPTFGFSDLPQTDPTADPPLPPGKVAVSLDATDDGVVTFTDAATVSMAWDDARVAGGPCS